MFRRLLVVVLLAIAASGCASTNPRDPFESYNRAMYGFNDKLDTYVLKPVAEGYRFVVPSIVRSGVRNFFANLEDVWIGANNLLQGKVEEGLGDWMRFAVNSTFGLGGLLDVASEGRLQKHNEDFGQTLGRWGVGSGPYVVLPFFGPSSVRDTAALPVDITVGNLPRNAAIQAGAGSNEVALRNSLWVTSIINIRAGLLDTTNLLDQAALDRYSFVRDAYLQRRRSAVYDGNPPKLKDDDDARLPPIDPSPAWAEVPASTTVAAETPVSPAMPVRVNGEAAAALDHTEGKEQE